jgi:uncharacterized iron-regulated protein
MSTGFAYLASLAAAVALAGGCTTAAGGPWQAPHAGDHPLAGTLARVADGRAVASADVVRAMREADVVLIGEQHDNPDHHRLQARLLTDMIAGDVRRPAVVFEMLDEGDREALARWRDEGGDADRLGELVGWADSGWPEWALYRPVFEAAVTAGLPIRTGNLSRRRLGELVRPVAGAGPETDRDAADGDAARDDLERRAVGALGGRLRAAELAAAQEEIVASHCGHAPPGFVDYMLRAQRLRDGYMAAMLWRAGVARGAVLVAGNGHVRNDRGVPWHLRLADDRLRIVSIGLLEVIDGLDTVADYDTVLHPAEDAPGLPFDYVWFTPRQNDEDPCERFAGVLEKMHERR